MLLIRGHKLQQRDMRCSCFGGPSADKKKGSAAETLHGIDDDLLRDINHISYNELRSATDNFASSNIIGRGGFGIVYKVVRKFRMGILRSRIQVAKFYCDSSTLVIFYHGQTEMVREVQILDLTGEGDLLFAWAWQLHEEGRPLELVDREMGEFPEEEVIRYIKVAFFCTQSAANRRPLMSQVVEMLSKRIRINDELLTAPGFFRDSDGTSGGPSKKISAESTSYQMSSVPVTITEVTPR
ncbi:hypothetical protein SADUNF_Sadunf04G0025700 [Salix dunnii]|uniref:Serine-threonine/tyrosine-protein kinase catalytic domain-containing protein n=1 Tax=Salix dunnii TaxID=1413687 RepID=A0A835K7S0_9ROSI|nr:hypothetical protein SADUNF_Sadunf04G0025700 [Salix dunnii]